MLIGNFEAGTDKLGNVEVGIVAKEAKSNGRGGYIKGGDSKGGNGNRKETNVAHAVVPGAMDIMHAVATDAKAVAGTS